MKSTKYYLGLDIGTDSVGWAVTDEEYNLIRFKGSDMWGAHLFDAGNSKAERRAFRTARRRLDRRQQRVDLIQEIFAKEIEKIDQQFFVRIKGSYLFRDGTVEKNILFNDPGYTDSEYYRDYPTIHHLICSLMNDPGPKDVRLVYIACAWLVAHRGHFLNNVSKDRIEEVTSFDKVYEAFINYFDDNGYDRPWDGPREADLKAAITENKGVNRKYTAIVNGLFGGKKPSKQSSESFPFSMEAVIKLICGGKVDGKALLCDEAFEDATGISLGDEDEKIADFMSKLDDRAEIIPVLKGLYDWTVLENTLAGKKYISEAKIQVYEQHRSDLKALKKIVKKYIPDSYDEIFREDNEKTDNYVRYSYHESTAHGKAKKDDFLKYVKGKLSKIEANEEDRETLEAILTSIENGTFMPKQKTTDNRVIPYQLYWIELKNILDKAKAYLPFLNDVDSQGLSNYQKILSVFEFRIPYFVGPLNADSSFAWIKRKAEGKILPWNFNDKVDLDASEQAFISRMTNNCTYLPGEPVLPVDSLAYNKFMVLNEINPITINGQPISVELKQSIYNDLFKKYRKVKRKQLDEYLIANGFVSKDDKESIKGIDVEIKSSLRSYHVFRRLLEEKILSESDVERIIERAAYSEDSLRFAKWLSENYPMLSKEDAAYVSRQKLKGFGRLSYRFLNQLEGTNKRTGEIQTILGALWNTNNNLMKLLSPENYSFSEAIDSIKADYYDSNKRTLDQQLDDMYVSTSVRRPIVRTFDIVSNVRKAMGRDPEKIFIEVTRENDPKKKGKRTTSRQEQINELFNKIKSEDIVRLREELNSMGVDAANKLRSDRIFLYYMQLGRCMYTGQPLDISKLSGDAYNIEHIYPQSLVKDDSVLNNKVLVLSEANGQKSDTYPIDPSIQAKMRPFWEMLRNNGLISDEKFHRLVRNYGFSDDEKLGFINRQLTETSQSTKAVASFLKEKFPESEIVYSKAGLVSDFRQEYGLLKSRTFNDLHHAKDAYLNIVVGNVYNMRFTKRFFNIHDRYNVSVKKLFANPVSVGGEEIWSGAKDIEKAKKTVIKNTAHLTVYAFTKKGGLFDQMPLRKSKDLIPLKKGMDTETYGGYRKISISCFIPVRYVVKKKAELILLPVELMAGEKLFSDENLAREYAEYKIKAMLDQDATEISFPLGLRKVKINSVISLDGFRCCIGGVSTGGTKLIVKPIMTFAADHSFELYVQRIESTAKKLVESKGYILDPERSGINSEGNLKLYDLYVEKIKNTVYRLRPNAPISIIENGRSTFENVTLEEQIDCLISMGQVFGRMSRGCDLTIINGAHRTASTEGFPGRASLWKKNYTDVRLIDTDAAGLHEKKTCNLLDLI